jgi:chromosome segregation ATPase
MLRLVGRDQMSPGSLQDAILSNKMEIQNRESFNQGLRVSKAALVQKLSTLQALLDAHGATGEWNRTPFTNMYEQAEPFDQRDPNEYPAEESKAMERLMREHDKLQNRIELLRAENSGLERTIAAHRDIGTIHYQADIIEVMKSKDRHHEEQLASLRATNANLRDSIEPSGLFLEQLKRERDDLAFEVKKLERELKLTLQKVASAEREVSAPQKPFTCLFFWSPWTIHPQHAHARARKRSNRRLQIDRQKDGYIGLYVCMCRKIDSWRERGSGS